MTGAVALALCLICLPQRALGLSLYDIVQLSKAGYPDQQIIDLVHDTGARFALDAKSLVRLKQAGVSEAVIEALIEARVPGQQEAVSKPEPLEPGMPEDAEESGPGGDSRGQPRRRDGLPAAEPGSRIGESSGGLLG